MKSDRQYWRCTFLQSSTIFSEQSNNLAYLPFGSSHLIISMTLGEDGNHSIITQRDIGRADWLLKSGMKC
eukprot:1156309-Pelagomonas_calceolata.AAC.6